ncbi:divalent-cation tolerance protein CutA [Lentisalinibacter sediminis]|uniref:divalent-cation tolerance protein CutA n=1 Tax=Lentisalinibacter sediminis TaxID=2992237 RepID=UPI00386926F8
MSKTLLVLCTCPDEETARSIATALVAEKRAACVNIVGPLRSVFSWQGEVCDESELLLIAKTTEAVWPELEARVVELHPYDVPEVIATPVTAGSAAYLDWVAASVSSPAADALDDSVTEKE